MAETNDPTGIVMRMFAAFGEGDLDTLIDLVHPESRWIYYGANPRLSKSEFVGKDEVRRFFEGIIKRLEMAEFNTDEFITEGDTVVIFGSEAGTVRKTGKRFRNVWSQKYVVENNLIVEMEEYNVQIEPRD